MHAKPHNSHVTETEVERPFSPVTTPRRQNVPETVQHWSSADDSRHGSQVVENVEATWSGPAMLRRGSGTKIAERREAFEQWQCHKCGKGESRHSGGSVYQRGHRVCQRCLMDEYARLHPSEEPQQGGALEAALSSTEILRKAWKRSLSSPATQI